MLAYTQLEHWCKYISDTHVRYTMASLPLFSGTVSSASGSSTTYMFFFHCGKYSCNHVTFSRFMLATTISTASSSCLVGGIAGSAPLNPLSWS